MKPTPTEQLAIDNFREAKIRLPIYLRHVKGHKDGDGRQWVNARCDEIAKRHMNEGRRERSAAA